MKKTIFIFCTFFLITGCKESAESLVATRKLDAEAKFDQFYACYDLAKTLPPIKEDKINWEKEDALVEYGEMNVMHVGFESFKDLSQPLEVPFDGMRRRETADMARLFEIDLSERKEEHNYENAYGYSYHETASGNSCREAILHFLNTKYLLISRNYTEQGAFVTGSDSFQEGYVFGEVLVFDVEQTKYLGGYRYEARSSETVYSNNSSDLDANVKADLDMKMQGVIREGFKEHTPWIAGLSFHLS